MSDPAKGRLRQVMQVRRRAACAAVSPVSAVPRLLAAIDGKGPVAAYWPIRSELDPRPAMAALHAAGIALALPVVVARDAPLAFRPWAPGVALVRGTFGVSAPVDGPSVRPATLIVPLLAFDRGGWRLGYGGGFYDRTLALMRATAPIRAVGLAFAAQEVPEVPHTVEDQRLDLIVTENECIEPDAASQCD